MSLANDVPQSQHVIRHLATYSSKPTENSLTVLGHLVGYLCSHMDVCVSLKWGGQATDIFHDYPNVDANEHVLEVFTDADWASDRVSKKVCKLLHCDVWKELDILSIKDSKDHLIVIS